MAKRKAKDPEEEEDASDDFVDAIVAKHKKLLKGEKGGAAVSLKGLPDDWAEKREQNNINAEKGDAATKSSKKDKKKKTLKEKAPRAAKAPGSDEPACEPDRQAAKGKDAKASVISKRQAKNEKARKEGKMTKKEKYKAAKAAKKAEAQKQKGQAPAPGMVPEEVLKKAGMERLNPKAVDCFLTGLPYMATERHIEEHFSAVGPCCVQLIRDKATGKPTGKAFATFSTAESALKASTYSGTKIQNRWINIRLCEVRDGGRGRPNADLTQKPEGCLSAVVMCDKSVSEASLWKFFEDCHVTGISCMTDKSTGEFRGMAFLDFEDTKHVDLAVAKSTHSIKGRPILVRYKSEKPSDGAKKDGGGRVAAHNRAPPVPAPCGKATKFEDSEEEGDDDDDE